MRKCLHYNLYCNGNIGISNLLSSVENAVIIGALTNADIKFYGKEYIDTHSRDPNHPKLTFFDLYDVNYPYEIVNTNNINESIHTIPFNTTESCVFYYEDKPTKDFLNGRENIFDLSSLLEYENFRTKDRHTLGFYSYLFYLNNKKKADIIDLIKRSIKPKTKYIDICNKVIAKNKLTMFNCIHLRRGDFCYYKDNVYPCYNVDTWYNRLENNFSKNEPLLIATDHTDKLFFKRITDSYKHVTFINDLLDPFNLCDVEKGLVTILIASKSAQFIGTFESTFTGVIQRYQMYNGFGGAFRFLFSRDSEAELDPQCHFIYNNTGEYSWNRINSTTKGHSIHSFHWKREWYESCH